MIDDMEQQYQYDFIERTQKLLEQYDKQLLQEEERFEVTLLLNACIGLLFICREKYNDQFPTSATHFDTIQSATKIETDKSLSNICRHIRNSIAHCNFELNSAAGKISSITFKDYPIGNCDVGKENFELTVSVITLRVFLLDVSTQTANNIKQHLQK